MLPSVCFDRIWQNNALRKKYNNFIARHPKTRQRDVATSLSINEAQLIDEQFGVRSLRLTPDFPNLLKDLEGLGYIMNLTRNEFAVHERKGTYQNVNIHGKMGLVIAEDKKIDLRLFLSQWHFVYAVHEELMNSDRYSLQFFDKSGAAVQKIFLQSNSNVDRYCHILQHYLHEHQYAPIEYSEKIIGEIPVGTVNAQALRNDWEAMTDVHQFVKLLRTHKITRQQAFRAIGDDYAEEFSPGELQRILMTAAESSLSIMCFVGNSGCIQIFTGTINKVKAMGPWLNILDPEFNLHLMESGITEAWLVRKPSSHGIITSLEFYADDGQQIVQFFGQRHEQKKENPLWTKLAESTLASDVHYKQVVTA
jgi:putative hemin transport protein